MKQINILVTGNAKSGKTFILNKLSHNSYVPKISNYTVSVWDNKTRFIFHEREQPDVEIIFAVVRCDADINQLYNAKNKLLKLYARYKCPVCVVYNDLGNDVEVAYAERNKALQIQHLKHVIVCTLNFNSKECQTRIAEILSWIARFAKDE